jgi:hypothetical protein
LRGGSQRVGSVHGLGNTTALLLHTLSWFARRARCVGERGDQRTPCLTSRAVKIAGSRRPQLRSGAGPSCRCRPTVRVQPKSPTAVPGPEQSLRPDGAKAPSFVQHAPTPLDFEVRTAEPLPLIG